MKKRILILLSAIVLAVMAGSFVWHYRAKDPIAASNIETLATTTTQAATTSPSFAKAATTPPVPFSASLTEIMASGRDLGCHYKATEDGQEIIGTVHVSEGRARGSFVGNIFGDESSIWYFLINGQRFYAWFILPTSAPKEVQGKAFLIDMTNDPDKKEAQAQITGIVNDLYGCVPWEFEEGFFELPRDLHYVNASGTDVTP